MVIKSVTVQSKNGVDDVIGLDVSIERLKRLRALNKKPDEIGLTQYTWRSFSISKYRKH